MHNKSFDALSEKDFDALLQNNMPELLPEDIVENVTPWRRAINRVLIGMVLQVITLNFLWLDYILPAIGLTLMILGFRALQRENVWFRIAWIASLVRAVYFFPLLILNATIFQGSAYVTPPLLAAFVLNFAIVFLLFFCLRRSFMAVQKKAGLSLHVDSATALVIWYALVCLLALLNYQGIIIGLMIIVAYIFIIKNLFKLSEELEEAGYAICASPVRLPDKAVGRAIFAFLVFGITCGYLFGGSYPMQWAVPSHEETAQISEIKAHLIGLGFPAAILDDLTKEDILACEGALQVVVDVEEYPINKGREVHNVNSSGERYTYWHTTTVYDVKELRITGIAVELPSPTEQWKIFHHFLWSVNPGFRGTEAIQLWPAYRNFDNGAWGALGEVTGQVLYDLKGQTYCAPYYSLESETYTAYDFFGGEQITTDQFAAFSMPNRGQAHRGYISYAVEELKDGYILDSWINYVHQRSRFQYPVLTAKDHQLIGSWLGNGNGPFIVIQDALQFFSLDEGVDLINMTN